VRQRGVNIQELDSYRAVNPQTREVKYRKQEFSLASTVDSSKTEKKLTLTGPGAASRPARTSRPPEPRVRFEPEISFPQRDDLRDDTVEVYRKDKKIKREDKYSKYMPGQINDDFSRVSSLVDDGELAWMAFLEMVKWVCIGSFIYASTKTFVKDMQDHQGTIGQCQACLNDALQELGSKRVELSFCQENFPSLFSNVDTSLDVFSEPSYEPTADTFNSIGVAALALSVIGAFLYPALYVYIQFYSEDFIDSLQSCTSKTRSRIIKMPPLILLLEVFGLLELLLSFLITWFIGSVHLYKSTNDDCYYSILNVKTETVRYSFFMMNVVTFLLYIVSNVYIYLCRFHLTSQLSYVIFYRSAFNIFILFLLIISSIFASLSLFAPFVYASKQPIVYFTAALICFSWLEAWGFLILPRTMVSSIVNIDDEEDTHE